MSSTKNEDRNYPIFYKSNLQDFLHLQRVWTPL